MTIPQITVVGAGILGLWQAFVFARRGHAVQLIEASDKPFTSAASQYGGTMLSPDCEAESAPSIVARFGHDGIAQWQAVYPDLKINGSLVVASPRDKAELTRFGRLTQNHTLLNGHQLGSLEADLANRFSSALFFKDEAHLAADSALHFLLDAVKQAGVDVQFSKPWTGDTTYTLSTDSIVIDCRGMAAKADLPGLRAVRGERLVIRTSDVHLNRPVRLLHPRHPLYVVPWGDGRFVLGATVIESEDSGGVSVRSALELLGAAYAVHPAFGEAEILDQGAGLRPAFADNTPRIIVSGDGHQIRVNGAYRHGFLLAPVLAQATADFVASGKPHDFIKTPKTACPTGQGCPK